VALTPLSSDQEAAIARLVSARRVEQVHADLNRASVFLEQAENTLADIENVTIAQNKYSLAYNAGHAAGQGSPGCLRVPDDQSGRSSRCADQVHGDSPVRGG